MNGEKGIEPLDNPEDFSHLNFFPYMRKTFLVEAAFLPLEKIYIIRTPGGTFYQTSLDNFVKLFSSISKGVVKDPDLKKYRKMQAGKDKQRKKNLVEPLD